MSKQAESVRGSPAGQKIDLHCEQRHQLPPHPKFSKIATSDAKACTFEFEDLDEEQVAKFEPGGLLALIN
jgi:hypothetical protein